MFLHVLGEVGLLGIGFAAVLADVCLQMLGFLVLGNVVEQRRLIREALVTGIAFEGFVGLVAAGVRLQIGKLRESLLAARMSTLVGLVARVCAYVLL